MSVYTDADPSEFERREVELGEIAAVPLMTALLKVGRLVEQDEETGALVGVVCAGAGDLNEALVAMKVDGGSLYICARAHEGVIAQGTAAKAVDKLLEEIGLGTQASGEQEAQAEKKARRRWPIVLALVAIGAVLAVVVCAYFLWLSPAIAATRDYNDAASAFNSLSDEYNAQVAVVSIENVEGMPTSVGQLAVVDEGWSQVLGSLLGGNSREKIEADTATIAAASEALQYDLAVVEAIDNPAVERVEQALQGVDGVAEVESVTEGNDPNEMLGKEGGYTSCVYFKLESLTADGDEEGPVAKGVDGGGAVEVYPTLADARERCDYLAGFDNSVLYSGSYALIGTMVVRTSCNLTADEQYDLTDRIFQALTDVEA